MIGEHLKRWGVGVGVPCSNPRAAAALTADEHRSVGVAFILRDADVAPDRACVAQETY
jgi:hypothetical protein